MENSKKIEWILRIAVAGEFIGHGIFALQGKKAWIDWIHQLTGAEIGTAATLLTLIGFMDLLVALIILARPIRAVVLWATFWGFWTALVRPLVGEPIWDFIERWANWGAPPALLLLLCSLAGQKTGRNGLAGKITVSAARQFHWREIRRRRKSEGGQKFLPPTSLLFARPSDWISEFAVRIFVKVGSDFNQKALVKYIRFAPQ